MVYMRKISIKELETAILKIIKCSIRKLGLFEDRYRTFLALNIFHFHLILLRYFIYWLTHCPILTPAYIELYFTIPGIKINVSGPFSYWFIALVEVVNKPLYRECAGSSFDFTYFHIVGRGVKGLVLCKFGWYSLNDLEDHFFNIFKPQVPLLNEIGCIKLYIMTRHQDHQYISNFKSISCKWYK